MKRSKSIKLVLIGTIATALGGCGPKGVQNAPITPDRVYTNNFFVPGVGYYHAPFQAFYSLPYNHYDLTTRRYFYGGQWGGTPFASITNISAPSSAVAMAAEAQRTDIARSGFGSTSHRSHVWS